MKHGMYLAEFAATFVMFLLAIGAMTSSMVGGGKVDILAIALAYGVGAAVMMTLAERCGAGHLNPALTLSLALTKRCEPAPALGLMGVQFAASIAAAFAARTAFPSEELERSTYGSLLAGRGISSNQALAMEVLLTFGVVLAYCMAKFSRRGEAGIPAGAAAGAMMVIGVLAGANVSGAAMNPARHLGSAWCAGWYDMLWIYIVGPIAGAILAAMLHRYAICGGETASPVEVSAAHTPATMPATQPSEFGRAPLGMQSAAAPATHSLQGSSLASPAPVPQTDGRP